MNFFKLAQIFQITAGLATMLAAEYLFASHMKSLPQSAITVYLACHILIIGLILIFGAIVHGIQIKIKEINLLALHNSKKIVR